MSKRSPAGRRIPRKVAAGLMIVGAFAVVAVIGPVVAPYNPSALSSAVLQGPSTAHLLGTTQTGQDVLSQLLVGTRSSLIVGLVAGLCGTALAVAIGVTSGYLGGVADDLLSTLTNVFLVIPALPLLIVLAGYMKNSSDVVIAVVIAATAWAFGARVLRAQTLSVRSRDFVLAARASGEGTFRIVVAEIMPNLGAIIASGFIFGVIFAILTQATLAFLGLGDPSSWSWGTILYWAQNNEALTVGAWWWFVPPGLCIAMFGAGLALCNFGIDEVINPRLRARSVPTSPAPPVRAVDRRPVNGLRHPGEWVLATRHLSVDYGSGPGAVHAVADVDLVLRRGEILGLAGESGSGKSTLAQAVTRLLRPPAVVTSGEVLFAAGPGSDHPIDVLALEPHELRVFRWEHMSMVFQGAMNVLNPVLDIATQLIDTLEAHKKGISRAEARERAVELLQMVRVDQSRLHSFPHQLSGGMRQRVMLAMAMTLQPDVVIMDEPTTALDVVVQREVLDEILRLRAELGFSVIFITHDLSLLLELADRIAIMYAGRIVEHGPVEALYRNPLHPYTEGLLKSFPHLRGPRRELTGVPGFPPDLRLLPPGCSFAARCPRAIERCTAELPDLVGVEAGDQHQEVACWLHRPATTASLMEGHR